MKKLVAAFVAFSLMGGQSAHASGESIGSLSHIHAVKVHKDKIILGTHEGVYQYLDEKSVQRISTETFDVMGLAISSKGFFASGHPGKGSKFPEPVGLLSSADGGKSWTTVALSGEVDFHTLETSGSEFYGADSGSGQLMYSSDGGKSWVKRGTHTFTDIAINPKAKGSVLAIKDGKLHRSTNAFKSSKQIATPFQIGSIDWVGERLIAAAGKDLYQSVNGGTSWKKVATLPAPIGIVAQSSQLIAVVVGGAIYASTNKGKSFKKYVYKSGLKFQS